MRQDQFVSQMMEIFLNIFEKEELKIFLKPINIITTTRGGIMETLIDSNSLVKIKKYNNSIDNLKHYFTVQFGKAGAMSYKAALKQFTSSLVGYSLLCYFLEIKDRHNGNIMIDSDGHLIHIDFGFLLNHSPGNVNFEKAPFKLTLEYVDLLEGLKSSFFEEFRSLFHKGFMAIRKNHTLVTNFVEIYMISNSDLPCFNDPKLVIENLKAKFLLEIVNEKMKDSTNAIIDYSLNNWRTKAYDFFQTSCVGIN